MFSTQPTWDSSTLAGSWVPLLSRNMRLLKDQFGFDTLAIRRELLRLTGMPAGGQALDVGTGSGWMAAVLAEGGFNVVALDMDQRMLLRARDNWKRVPGGCGGRVNAIQGDALQLPFRSGVFDAVFSFDTLHHMPDCPRAVTEMLRVRKPTGVFAVADLNLQGLHAVAEVMARGGELHSDNGCRMQRITDILGKQPVRFERHELEFVTVYILRPDPAVHR